MDRPEDAFAAPPADASAGDEAAPLYAPHHDGRRFFNPWERLPVRFADVLRWYRERPWRRPPESPAPRVANDGGSLRVHEAGVALTWIGHASFALHHGHHVVLTDPHFGARALLPRRHVAPGLPLAAIPAAPLVVLSHNHYDHLDRWTVRRLPRDTRWRVPRGLGGTLQRWGARDVVELDWWESCVEGDVHLTCVPAQHWSNRLGQARNASLWCGWMIEMAQRRVYFAGDTGWFGGFAELGRRFAPIDAALLPIGAYEPRWFMRYQHIDPAEAVEALLAMQARHLVGMHWGTFVLTDEPLDEPPLALRRVAAARALDESRLVLLAVGERWRLP